MGSSRHFHNYVQKTSPDSPKAARRGIFIITNKLPLLLIMMLLLQHHILHLHQADLRASLIFIQLHRDIFDIFARLRNNYVFQRIDSPARFLDLGAMSWQAFSVSDSRSISGRMSASDLTAPSRSLEVNANPYE